MVETACRLKPSLVTLVPEKREELTTEGGLDVNADPAHYKEVVGRLKGAGVRVSFFIDPDPKQIDAAQTAGADVVEIHTGHYADATTGSEADEQFQRIVWAVKRVAELKMGVSAGHGLNYVNVKRFKSLPQVGEYSIGHSIISRAVIVGLERAVRDMIALVKDF